MWFDERIKGGNVISWGIWEEKVSELDNGNGGLWTLPSAASEFRMGMRMPNANCQWDMWLSVDHKRQCSGKNGMGSS
jgi:hypothetical protein